MKKIDHYPKSIVKAIRYIKQDAPSDRLEEIEHMVLQAIAMRKQKEKVSQ
ncbi:hypothetical protein [Bacillus suaedae]|uniref:Uncharacterized protein n=1 Tax=Halalkalibacter suaedae TaxID=2822140 RepID=A0A940WUU0_9BACI|nr:hypothetical protein [Bacillus suaedae]MBP3953164.1 hypothetical protein [Bacillus suaedae]